MITPGPKRQGLRIAIAIALAAMFIVLATGPARAANIPPPDPSCHQEPGLKSLKGTQPATLQFVNNTSETLQTFWLNYQGKRVFYAQIPAGGSYSQPTWVTHPWVVADLTGMCLKLFVTNATQGVVVVGTLQTPTPSPSLSPSATPLPTSTPLSSGAIAAELHDENPGVPMGVILAAAAAIAAAIAAGALVFNARSGTGDVLDGISAPMGNKPANPKGDMNSADNQALNKLATDAISADSPGAGTPPLGNKPASPKGDMNSADTQALNKLVQDILGGPPSAPASPPTPSPPADSSTPTAPSDGIGGTGGPLGGKPASPKGNMNSADNQALNKLVQDMLGGPPSAPAPTPPSSPPPDPGP